MTAMTNKELNERINELADTRIIPVRSAY